MMIDRKGDKWTAKRTHQASNIKERWPKHNRTHVVRPPAEGGPAPEGTHVRKEEDRDDAHFFGVDACVCG